MRLLVLGIDCLSAHVIRQYPDATPFISSLSRRGASGTLRSLAAGHPQLIVSLTRSGKGLLPHTGPCWATIYTGVPPETHSITHGGWLLEHAGFDQIATKTVWEIISEHCSVGLFTMPITFPPPDLPNDSWVVSGFPSPPDFRKCVSPADLASLLPEEFRIDFCDGQEPKGWRDNLDDSTLFNVLRAKDCAVRSIIRERPVDVLAFGITMLDRMHHAVPLYSSILSWFSPRWTTPQVSYLCGGLFRAVSNIVDRFQEPNARLLAAYQYVDEIAAALHRDLAPQATAIVSDHGAQKYTPFHDFEGFYCFVSEGRDDVNRTCDILDCASELCALAGVPATDLGMPVVRSAPEVDETVDDHISARLDGLGYL